MTTYFVRFSWPKGAIADNRTISSIRWTANNKEEAWQDAASFFPEHDVINVDEEEAEYCDFCHAEPCRCDQLYEDAQERGWQ